MAAAYDFLRTDVCDLVDNIQIDTTTSSFITVIEGVRTHQEHMIEQQGNLDMLRILLFTCFLKSWSRLWCLVQKYIEHDFIENMEPVSPFLVTNFIIKSDFSI